MNKLSKDQRDEMATSLAVLALYDGGVSHELAQLARPLGLVQSFVFPVLVRFLKRFKLSIYLSYCRKELANSVVILTHTSVSPFYAG